MTLLGLAKRVERLGPTQLSLCLFHWRLKPSTFDHLHHEIQGDQFGGKQVEGSEGQLVHARSLIRVSKAHRDASRPRKALTSCDEALRVLHAMGSDSPERRGTIARAFLERFYVQRNLGNEKDSLSAIRQACLMIGDLCCDRDARGHYIPLLHTALSLLANAPHPFPSDESSSIQGAREALDIWRKLYESDDLLFKTPYASALFTLATSFEESGLPNDAAKTAQDAVDIFRGRYYDRQHDTSAVLALTAAMFTQAELLTRIGRIDDALSILGKRVSLYRQVLAKPPSDTFALERLQANLGHTLLEQSQCAHKASLYKQACSADEEAVEIFRSLFAERPLVYRSTLAEALSNWAGNLCQLGSEDGCFLALEPARNALLLWGGSPTWNPRNPYHYRCALAAIDIIAKSLVALCSTEILKDEEHTRQASLAAQHAITVWRELSNVEDPVSSESEDGDPSLALLDVMTNLATYHLQRPFYADDHASLGVHLDAYRESLDIPGRGPHEFGTNWADCSAYFSYGLQQVPDSSIAFRRWILQRIPILPWSNPSKHLLAPGKLPLQFFRSVHWRR
ncbi:hypothetical protein BS47DRAFT_83771 [Hydnum rufescens UP504]|uniref:Uncharacterized protein n=1 Tax=Hydnum rufescens UP504 TaxID=1448309 RepID=A0A9P6B835_9AGAM|nr:hypothetical protein BS47DRAFT_83771 [Hydnum rufescens UP504]